MARGYELVGRLYKKRGGLGRHAKSPWVHRTFALGYDGVLSYFDTEALEKPRGTLNLVRAEASLAVTSDPNDDSPSKHMIIITHLQGQRWKLCAETAAEVDDWAQKLAKFCRSDGVIRPGETNGAVAPLLTQTTTPTLKELHKRSSPSEGLLRGSSRQSSLRGESKQRHRERRGSKTAKEFAVTATRSTRAWVRVSSAIAAVNLSFLFAYVSDSLVGAFLALIFANIHIALVVARCLNEAPPTSETLVAMIVPPARLPPFLFREEVPSLEAEEEETSNLMGLREVPFDVDGGPPGTWSKSPASTFRLRDVGYAKHKKKSPSDDAFYDVIAVHLFDCEGRVNRVVDKVKCLVDSTIEASPDPDVPASFVVNAQIPAETGPLRANLDADGHGYQVVVVLALTDRTRQELAAINNNNAATSNGADNNGSSSPLTPENARTRALLLLQRYCRLAPSEPQIGAKERGRFKVLAQVRNIDEVDIPAFVKGYNGKPALINKTGLLTKFPNGLEMDVNCHAFGYLARKGLQSIYRDFQDFILTIGFVIEARDDSELPELALAAFDLNHPNWTMASEIPLS